MQRRFHYISLLLIFTGILSSCENNIEVIKNLDNSDELPVVTMKGVDITYSDSAKIKMRITASSIRRFVQTEKEITEFPEGILVNQFDSAMNVIASIRANNAVYNEKTKIWIARGNVVARNAKNEQLTSEELFWNMGKGIIYSTKSTTIVNADGVFYGEGGFEANEDLSQYKMIGIKGKVNLKEGNDSIRTP